MTKLKSSNSLCFKKTNQEKVKMFKTFKEWTNYKYHLGFRKLLLSKQKLTDCTWYDSVMNEWNCFPEVKTHRKTIINC